MSNERSLNRRDPVEETYALIVERLESSPSPAAPILSMETVAAAWHEVLAQILQLRVGERLSTGMTSAQLDEFEQLIDDDQDDAAQAWLEENAPHYPQVVDHVMTALVVEAADWFGSGRFRLHGMNQDAR
ncbi:DUF5663 domain-containing protein [Microbacterium sp. ASV49]|uniref:DUF5663 domain-containing protein n=1 Tax=Microbacterium candidum TaxID=3041922 RepID=A0ABT7MW27_9MICO|nr:DUF5663 domain-containing protein [Microbacterium sp. ASV49]MDL9978651.1 DUF5663 domain-containing protein [Microbacterium sp. ASV49]